MSTNPTIRNIIDLVNNNPMLCRGQSAFSLAETVVKDFFADERLAYTRWEVTEIPVADDSDEYPVAVVICIINRGKKIGISVNVSADGKLLSCNPDELCMIKCKTIAEAINNPAAKYVDPA